MAYSTHAEPVPSASFNTPRSKADAKNWSTMIASLGGALTVFAHSARRAEVRRTEFWSVETVRGRRRVQVCPRALPPAA